MLDLCRGETPKRLGLYSGREADDGLEPATFGL
jgi:hypothetical protein